jgi:hypothetical protein
MAIDATPIQHRLRQPANAENKKITGRTQAIRPLPESITIGKFL